MPLMKEGATLAYSHGFNIVEEARDTGRYGEIRRDVSLLGHEIRGDMGRCSASRARDTGRYGEMFRF